MVLGAQALSRIGGRRLLRAAGVFAAAALLSRARMALGLSPFGLGLFAAGLTTGESAVALLLGCILGALRIPLTQIDILLPAGCALSMLGALMMDRLPAARKVPESAAGPVLAGAAIFLPGLLRTELEAYPMVLLLVASVVAAVSAAAFQALLTWKPSRVRMHAEARAPAALLLFAALMGLREIWEPGAFLLASLVAIAAADSSPGLGAMMGALTGMALLSGGSNAIVAVSLSLGGAVAGLLANRGRLWVAPGFVLATGLAGLYAPDAFPGPVAPAIAAGLYVAAPEEWLKWLRSCVFFADEPGRQLREEAANALRSLGSAFGELAAGVGNTAVMDEQAVFSDLRDKLCDSCAGYRDCWAGEDDRAVRLLCRAISDAAVFGDGRPPGEATPDVMRVCRRGDRLPSLVEEQLRNLRRRRGEEGVFSGSLFFQAEKILKDMALRQERPEPARRALNIRWGASAVSKSPGTPSGDAHILRTLPDGRTMMLLSDGMGSGEAAREESERAARLLWKFLAARVDPETAFQTVNELMLLRSDGDMYATVDLCLIDPVGRRADFLKLAASRSLIVRGGEVIPVEGGRLPLGVLEGVVPSAFDMELRPGDLIVMGTDGAMENGPEGYLENILLSHATLPPNELADAILRAAEEVAANGGRRDDMTCLCARILRYRATRDPPP
ncbi:MAG: SpoIIE family protein phosphatase [Clostridiales bacterium]|nr:SpoIIE family protein phosphatase [Clostridiales bacterium]